MGGDNGGGGGGGGNVSYWHILVLNKSGRQTTIS